jgi:hypothetical protein
MGDARSFPMNGNFNGESWQNLSEIFGQFRQNLGFFLCASEQFLVRRWKFLTMTVLFPTF